ncbi:hypothetical protein QTO34_016944 [Cnephaeus nilssonii]|uniref:Rubicon PI3K-binding domain-containing protein n=1 Tax=Cnephaeus nilssonii TaxID=3371016 RepID=A0AA40I365_CNENI|nr:hypothetical protein QTO34_016944 [Eptesicus nilssonii]
MSGCGRSERLPSPALSLREALRSDNGIHINPEPGKMVSQSLGQQDFPVEPWEGGVMTLVTLMVRPASWTLTTPLAHQTSGYAASAAGFAASGANSEEHWQQLCGDAASPLGTSPLSLENSVVETSSWKDTVGSVGSSGKKSSDFSFNPRQERAVPPGRSPWMSPFTGSKILTASPCSEADSACFKPSHLPASTEEGAVQINGRSILLNSFSPEAFMLPVDVEKENAHFYAADMIIAAMEKMKCHILSQQHTETWSVEEASGSLGNDPSDPEVTFYTNRKQESGSSTFSNSGYEGKHILPFLSYPMARTSSTIYTSDGETMTRVSALTRVAISDDTRPHDEDETFAAPEDETFATRVLELVFSSK